MIDYDNLNVIDFVGNDDEHVACIISDALDWSDELGHLCLLREKVNNYVAFIESGQVFENHPEREGKRIKIQLMSRCGDYPESAILFFKSIRDTLIRGADYLPKEGVVFEYGVLEDDDSIQYICP